jgi:dTDP-glucose 4,6-dehydratase
LSEIEAMQKYQPNKILVTGSAGFIGANFVHFLLEKNPAVKIISLDKLTYAGDKKNLDGISRPNDHILIAGDICDRALVNQLLRQHEIDTVVHFAAESHVDRSITGPAEFIQTNIVGTFNLLDAARNYWLVEKKWGSENCRFHHISTDEVYGDLNLGDPAFAENHPYRPSSPYSASKASSDHLVRAFFRTYQLPITVSNCSNNYGPYQNLEKLIPTVISSCFEEKPIPVYGNGSNVRDWLYVLDHCVAIEKILIQGKVGETYNIGGGTEIDNLSLVKMICEIMDQKHPRKEKHQQLITFVKDRPGHDWRYAIDNSKINRELGWKPEHTLREGLDLTIGYYLEKVFNFKKHK